MYVFQHESFVSVLCIMSLQDDFLVRRKHIIGQMNEDDLGDLIHLFCSVEIKAFKICSFQKDVMIYQHVFYNRAVRLSWCMSD